MSKLFRAPWFWVILVFFIATHILGLTALPVFADESIYIRWAQLLVSDPQQYFFFALNDGKTPLFIWLLGVVLRLFSDPLVAGRVLSVLVGAGQLIAVVLLITALGGNKRAQLIGALGVTVLPFWYFHHRVALMDGMLTLFVSLCFWVSSKLVLLPLPKKPTASASLLRQLGSNVVALPVVSRAFLAGVFLGLALLSKLPAVLCIPALFGLLFLPKQYTRASLLVAAVRLCLVVVVAGIVFSSLLLHPAVGQLFSRGSDFLFSFREIKLGYWVYGFANIPNYLQYFWSYLTPAVLLFSVAGVFSKKQRRLHLALLCAALLFFLPIAILGKVVYPRYFLPIALFFTTSTALSLDEVLGIAQKNLKLTKQKLFLVLLLVGGVGHTLAGSFSFMYYSILDSNQTPFVSADRQQYLTEWSSGHGIVEVVALIESERLGHSLAVATEGFFGTLPDGLLMYFDNRSHDNLLIEGIGQPVAGLPVSFVEKARRYDTVWLVVNEHRLLMTLPSEKLVHEYCRPFDGPCLQVWDVGELIPD